MMKRGPTILLLFVFAVMNTACANQVSLSFDDGQPEDGVWIDDLRGHSVVFTAPCDNWTLSGVALCGMLVPEAETEMFIIEVWDDNLSLLSRTTDRARSYFSNNLTWAEIDVPDVQVSGNFVVSFYEFAGVYLGTDLSLPYGRSAITARNPNRILPWEVQNHTWNETNWMIRAAGYSPEPTVTLKIPFDKAGQISPARIEASAQDPDGNLQRAALYIVSNETGEIVWSEAKSLQGESGKAQFSWPGTMFQIAFDEKSLGPVYAINAQDIAENISALLAYSAPAVLELQENRTGSVLAFFGADGRLNALMDVYGGTYYLSPDVLAKTNPDLDYTEYAKDGLPIINDQSRIWLLKAKVPSSPDEESMALIGPFLLSGSPLQNYGLKLQKVNAETGEYVVLVEVQDSAYNAALEMGDRTIEVA